MTICCQVFPRRDATPRHLMDLGAALHRWYTRETREHGMALYANGDAVKASSMANFLRYRRPAQADEGLVVPFDVRGKGYNRRATIESLSQDIPADLVEEVLIDGRSWTQVE